MTSSTDRGTSGLRQVRDGGRPGLGRISYQAHHSRTFQRRPMKPDRVDLNFRERYLAVLLLNGALGKSALQRTRTALSSTLPSVMGVPHSLVVEEGLVLHASACIMGVEDHPRRDAFDGIDLESVASEVAWVAPDFMPTKRCQETFPFKYLEYRRLTPCDSDALQLAKTLGMCFLASCHSRQYHLELIVGTCLAPFFVAGFGGAQDLVDLGASEARSAEPSSNIEWPPKPPRAPMWLRDFFFLG